MPFIPSFWEAVWHIWRTGAAFAQNADYFEKPYPKAPLQILEQHGDYYHKSDLHNPQGFNP